MVELVYKFDEKPYCECLKMIEIISSIVKPLFYLLKLNLLFLTCNSFDVLSLSYFFMEYQVLRQINWM